MDATGPESAADAIVALYDELVRRLGFDSQNPGWSPALRDLHALSRARRLQIIPEFFYTPVLSPAGVPDAAWRETFPYSGSFDLDTQRAFLAGLEPLQSELAQYGYAPSAEESEFHWGNDQFSHADAAIYYTLLRRRVPNRIVEVGSGHSTKLALHALKANGTGRIYCIDPHPPNWLKNLPGPIEIANLPVQEIGADLFGSLQSGDVLFIDSSHISKTGSDVNHLLLRVLPKLAPGVLVHIHDICLPFEYPKQWSDEYLCYWNEQYVLAGLLTDSRRYEILIGIYYLQKTKSQVLLDYIPKMPGVWAGGGSLWLRIRDS